MTPPRALVLGGTGAVGSEVVRGLARAGIPTVFTYHRSKERAEALAGELAGVEVEPVEIDLADSGAIRALIQRLERDGKAPAIFIHTAVVSHDIPLADITDEMWQQVIDVNARSAFVACQELAPRMAGPAQPGAKAPENHDGGGDIVLVGALDRTQSVPVSIHFGASQGMLSALTMALSKELGPRGVRINMVALGVLESGLSRQITPQILDDYKSFSALRRVGTPAEAARVILWLALENTYMSGKVISVNGGI